MSDATSSTASYWCEYAWLGGAEVVAGVVVDVAAGHPESGDGGQVVGVRHGMAPPPSARRREGLTLPGLANAHSHAFHRALRGRTHVTGSFWTWRDAMYAVAGALDPDRLHRLARATYAEMVLAGYTSVGEFHYVHHAPDGGPYAEPNAMGDALVRAAADAGIRITLLDVCYLHGGIGVEVGAGQRRFSDGSVGAWIDRASARAGAPHVRLGAAVHSVRACTPDEISSAARWAAEADLPLHAHVSEQPVENEQCLVTYGRTPVQVFEDAGALGARFCAVHATHLDRAGVASLGSSGSTVCLCPTTERDLADGIGPAGRLASAGARLAVGSDSQAVVDGFEEIRAVELDERLATGVRGTFGAPALVDALAPHGHRALGWPDAGRLAVGSRADLVTVSLDSVRLAGCDESALLDTVLFSATAADVTDVTVDGVDVVVDRCHARIDVASELRAAVAEVGAERP